MALVAALCLMVYPQETESFVSVTLRGASSASCFRKPLGASQTGSSLSALQKITLDDGEVIEIVSRSVAVTDDWTIDIWEQFDAASTIEHYWNMQSRSIKVALDPFGLVNWPGSTVAAQELKKYKNEIKGASVLVLGAGTGVEAQAVAMLGARKVIATDYNPTTLKLLEYGAMEVGLDTIISTQHFDLCGFKALPDCDILIAADVMYSDRLSTVLGDRILEALKKADPPKVLVTDSQRFADFTPKLRKILQDESLRWEERLINSFVGSGVMIEEDQTYDVKARVLSIGWNK